MKTTTIKGIDMMAILMNMEKSGFSVRNSDIYRKISTACADLDVGAKVKISVQPYSDVAKRAAEVRKAGQPLPLRGSIVITDLGFKGAFLGITRRGFWRIRLPAGGFMSFSPSRCRMFSKAEAMAE